MVSLLRAVAFLLVGPARFMAGGCNNAEFNYMHLKYSSFKCEDRFCSLDRVINTASSSAEMGVKYLVGVK